MTCGQDIYAFSKPLCDRARCREGCMFIARNSSMATSRCGWASARSEGVPVSNSSASDRFVRATSGRCRMRPATASASA